jgi:RHS repeat-associated protein
MLQELIETEESGSDSGYADRVFDNEDILLELDGSNNITARYTHGLDTDEPLIMERGAQSFFYHADALGSITEISNSGGSLVQRYTYSSFGKIESQLDPNFVQPYTLTAREFDPETGLYHYRARQYDSIAGRFTAADPIWFHGGINFYAYVDNNPVRWLDPYGQRWTEEKRRICQILRTAVLTFCRATRGCTEDDSCVVLRFKIALHKGCILAQESLTRNCYPDNPTHEGVIKGAKRGIEICEGFLATCNCRE